MAIENGSIAISTLYAEHPDAEVSVSGSVDLLQSAATVSVESTVNSIQSWVSGFEAEVSGIHTVEADWASEVPVASVSGHATGSKRN